MWMNWHGCLGTVGDYNSVPLVRDKVDLAILSGGLGSAKFRYIYLLCFFLSARPDHGFIQALSRSLLRDTARSLARKGLCI